MLRALSYPLALILRVLVTLVLALTAVAIATPTASSDADDMILIDSGGNGGTDADGHVWMSDRYFTGGQAMSSNDSVDGTRYQGVFQDWRRDVSAYRIPLANGTYFVKLLESESYWNAPGERVFDVRAEGVLELDDVDIFARAGGAGEALYLVFKSTVTDGRLDLVFDASVDVPKVDGIVIDPASTTPEPTSTPTPAPAPASSVLWGMDDNDTFDSTEAGLGRKFALVREYRRLDQSFLNARMKSLAAGGRSLVLSVTARNINNYIKYADITAGKYDTAFLNGWASLQALPTKTYFIFQHEADSTDAKASCSSPADSICGPQFEAAWKHLYTLAKSRSFPKVVFTWTVTNYGFHPQTDIRNKHYWPGASYTDWIGVDAYSGGCNSDWWGDLEDIMRNSINWLKVNAPNKSILMPEWGAIEGDTASAKPNFFKDAPATLAKDGYDKIRGVVYWNQRAHAGCDYRINSTTASYGAFKTLGLNPVMAAKAS